MPWKKLVAGRLVKFSVFMKLLFAVAGSQIVFSGSSIMLLSLVWFWGFVRIVLYEWFGRSSCEVFF